MDFREKLSARVKSCKGVPYGYKLDEIFKFY